MSDAPHPHPQIAQITHALSDDRLGIKLECPHGCWTAYHVGGTDELRGATKELLLRIIEPLVRQLLRVHDSMAYPPECIVALRPPDAVVGDVSKIDADAETPIFYISDPTQTIIVQRLTSAQQYRVRMMCDHGVSDAIFLEEDIPVEQRGENYPGSADLYDSVKSGMALHASEFGCTCLDIPPFDLFTQMPGAGIVGFGVVPIHLTLSHEPTRN